MSLTDWTKRLGLGRKTNTKGMRLLAFAGLALVISVICLSCWVRFHEALHLWWTRRAQRSALTRIVREGRIPGSVAYEGGMLARRRDGSEMALIPAGEFTIGSAEETPDERPTRRIYLSAYLIDRFEVTNRQFGQFIAGCPEWTPGAVANSSYLPHWRDGRFPAGRADHPVHHVTWSAAHAYAQWAGAALPTEAQWEKAARGGLQSRRYPWGDRPDPTKANWGRPRWMHVQPGAPFPLAGFKGAKFDNPGTTPVGAFGANAYGLHDVAGNVWEWCRGWYDAGFYDYIAFRDPDDPQIPFWHDPMGWGGYVASHALRGGSWYRRPYLCMCANRSFDHLAMPIAHLTDYYYGFRCVVELLKDR